MSIVGALHGNSRNPRLARQRRVLTIASLVYHPHPSALRNTYAARECAEPLPPM
jgi:hypothetical protein